MSYLTKTARKKLARQAANRAYGKANNHQVGRAGKMIDEIVNENPKEFIEFHDRYCTPKHEAIITAVSETLIAEKIINDQGGLNFG